MSSYAPVPLPTLRCDSLGACVGDLLTTPRDVGRSENLGGGRRVVSRGAEFVPVLEICRVT